MRYGLAGVGRRPGLWHGYGRRPTEESEGGGGDVNDGGEDGGVGGGVVGGDDDMRGGVGVKKVEVVA